MTRRLSHLPTFVAELSCPMCQEPFTMAKVHPDPRGVEMPYCCGVYWVPRWKFVNGHLQVHLTFYFPDGMPHESNIIHENEIREDHTDSGSTASESQDETQTDRTATQTDRDAVIPETSVETSDETPGASSRQPLAIATASELTVKERILEFLQQVNEQHEARTGEIREALDIKKSTFKWASDELIEAGQIERVGYGVYRLLRQR